MTEEQFNNLKAGDTIRFASRKMIVTKAPYADKDFTKIHALHVTKTYNSLHILDDMDCRDITFVSKDDPKYPAMKSCTTCRFRGTYYCSHPHTSNNGQGRCSKTDILDRINRMETDLKQFRRRDTKQALQMLEEWEEEMK